MNGYYDSEHEGFYGGDPYYGVADDFWWQEFEREIER